MMPSTEEDAVARNRRIYTENYTAGQLEIGADAYNASLAEIRATLLRDASIDRIVLDLGCGTGTYSAPIVPSAAGVIGLDFSSTLLEAYRSRPASERAVLVQANANAIPLADEALDVIASYCTLYYVPEVSTSIAEIARVLRPGGTAILEFGNHRSLTTLASSAFHRQSGWAEPHHVTLDVLRASLAEAGLSVGSWRRFNVLPMVGTPERLRLLSPLLTTRWRRLMGKKVGDRLLDEVVSSLPGLRRVAFRHLVVATRVT